MATKKKEFGTYNKYIRKFPDFKDGEVDFADIRFDDIQKNLNSMVSIAKDDTIQRAMSIWRRLYRYAVAKDIVMKDETYNVQSPRSDILTIKKSMTITENDFQESLKLIWSSMVNKREAYLIICALWILRYEGMRPSEVLGLEKKNIDLENRMIYVCQRVGTNSTESNVITHAKTESSIRYLPIVDEVYNMLKELINNTEGEYLFVRDNGELMHGTYLSDRCRKNGGGLIRPYQLRHQFATDLVIGGTDVRTIQELMGHRSSSMTIDYARSNDDLKRNALENRVIH